MNSAIRVDDAAACIGTHRAAALRMRRENRQIVRTECRLIDLRDFTLSSHDHRLHVRRRHHRCASLETDPRKQLEGLSRAIAIDSVHFIADDGMTAAKGDAAPGAVAQLHIRESKIRKLLHEIAMLPAEPSKTGGENSDRYEEAFEQKVVVAIEELIAVITVREAAHAVE